MNKRLQRVFADRKKIVNNIWVNIPFGGISIILLGDWVQINPVGDSPIWALPEFIRNNPSEREIDRLRKQQHVFLQYREFKTFIRLNEIMRQQGESRDQIDFITFLLAIRDDIWSAHHIQK